MYSSLINRIFHDISYQITQDGENKILEAVQGCDIIVDKEELLKALKYDRNQYEKGYKTALYDLPVIKDSIKINEEDILARDPDYIEIIKKQICDNIAGYLYEKNLVNFETIDIPDRCQKVIIGKIKIYDPEKGEYSIL